MQRRTSRYLTNDRQMFEAIQHAKSTGDNSDNIRRLKMALKKVIETDLTARQKEYLMLYYYENMDMTEISKQYNVQVSTVSRTIARARNNILKYLKYMI